MLRKMLCLTTLAVTSLGAFAGSAGAATSDPLSLSGSGIDVRSSANNLKQITLAVHATDGTYRIRWDVVISE